MTNAIAVVHQEGGICGVSFPDFPGAVATGRSIEEALRRAADVLSFHVAGMIEDGDLVPAPRSGAELQADPDFRTALSEGALLALVPFELPGRAVRVNISIDENLLASIDKAAGAAGQSRSAFLAEAARKSLR